MHVLQVFDSSLADKLRGSGWEEIKLQYGIKQAVWAFVYDMSKPLCFDIDDAIKSGKCHVGKSFTMTF